ncbi:MAG: hypothetical protein A3G81_09495 [Betaproteobacteria bacterium RIFCSPLOWO2_12_FULL_65_14]|nr:MAG: hypothetical protein A3G81_09495 [Betaproteobacteria bacterium RIFCSPLOWO2_12_FULL_65_14]
MTSLAIRTTAVLAALVFALGVQNAHAQAYPAKPVKMIVPYPPGGGTDSVARNIAQRLSDAWHQPVVVENRPGAGTTIGAEAVAKSPADGYTLLFSDTATFLINPYLYSKLSYDPLKDFAPITIATRLAPVLAVANAVPVKNMRELLAYAKSNPGKLTYASPGNGSYPHIAMEALKKQAGLDLIHVPYKGSSPAMADLLAGRVSMYMVTYSVFDKLEQAGKLKVVASATPKRLSVRPDLPTISESGVPGYTVNVWFGMAAPAGTPDAILDKVHADVVRILRSDEFEEKVLKPQALERGGMSRAEFLDELKQESVRWGELVRNSGAKLD